MNPIAPAPRPLPDQSRQPVSQPARQSTQDAAANVIREQINSIYSGGSAETTPHTTPASATATQSTAQPTAAPQSLTAAQSAHIQQSTTAPAQHPSATAAQSAPATHGLRTAPPATQASPQNTTTSPTAQQPRRAPQATPADWQQYHSAWQKYYQLYYERYYANHLHSQAAQSTEQATSTEALDFDAESPEKAAMRELRTKIRNKVRAGATTVKKSRHFVPVLAGVAVFLVFMFLQYNRILFGMVAAYTSPGNIDPQNIIVDPGTNVAVGPEPRLIIPKINVDAPVVYGAAPDVASQRKAMEQGVAHFAVAGASATPGQIGNTVLAAHSSNDAFAAGDYKFVFAQNEKLGKGDLIYTHYEGKRYTYSITSTEVVMPQEIGKIQLQTDKPMLTLVSCVPIGTAEKRLLIFAEQISPDPKGAETPKQADNAAPQSADIPGNPSPTLLERLFGAG
ncbi:MAG: sortase [Candidatus Saccharibacteria bacterium]|nr:sortase [Candidatus Saccharibacteria bacterium]